MRLQSTPFLKDRTFIKYHPTERVSKALFRERERERERDTETTSTFALSSKERTTRKTLYFFFFFFFAIYIYIRIKARRSIRLAKKRFCLIGERNIIAFPKRKARPLFLSFFLSFVRRRICCCCCCFDATKDEKDDDAHERRLRGRFERGAAADFGGKSDGKSVFRNDDDDDLQKLFC